MNAILESLKLQLKEFLNTKLVAKLDELVLKSPNKIDDMAWGMVRTELVKWINTL
jgi:hypothetical protein